MRRIDDEGKFIRFTGFPTEGLRFLRQLRRNNRREWFLPRKSLYEKTLRLPMEVLLVELRERLRPLFPEMSFDPKRCIFRLYRDIRFSEDKTPYKTHIAAYLPLPRGKNAAERPCFYINVEPGEVFLGGGLYVPSSIQLARIRARIDESPRSFLRIVENPALRRTFGGLKGERLKRPPKGYAKDHPHLSHLQWKQFFMGITLKDEACLSPAFAKKAAATFEKLAPLVRWLDDSIRD